MRSSNSACTSLVFPTPDNPTSLIDLFEIESILLSLPIPSSMEIALSSCRVFHHTTLFDHQ